MFKNYLKIAFRNLWNNKFFTVINVIGLALGLVACLLISLFIYEELSYDRFHKNAKNIYRVFKKENQADGQYETAVTPGPLAPTLKGDFPEVAEVARIGGWYGNFRQGEKVFEEKQMFFVDHELFRIFDFPLVKGSINTVLKKPNELVINEKTALKYFGEGWEKNNSILGKPFKLNGGDEFILVGIAKDLPTNSHFQFDFLMSFEYVKQDKSSYNWGSNNFHTYVLLQEGANAKEFEQKIENQLIKYNEKTESKLKLQALTDIHLYSKFAFYTDSWNSRGDILYVKIFAAVGFIVLFIACFNFINLTTARASKRSKEVGVRKVIGAQRYQLVIQFVGESLMLVIAALVIALSLLAYVLPFFNQITEKTLIINYLSIDFWLFVFAFALAIGLLAGAYPALLLSSYQPVKVLKGILKIDSGKNFRKTLIAVQFIFSIALIICTVGIYSQLQFIQEKDLGFDKAQLLYVRMGGNLRAKSSLLKEDLQKLSFVEAVSASTSNLVNTANESNIEYEGQTKSDDFVITQMMTDPDFIPLAGMKMVHGRNFSYQTKADTAGFIINEEAAKRMGYTGESAIGKKVKFWGLDGSIIGVAKDFHFRPLNVPIAPLIMRYRPQEFYFNLLVKVKPNQVNQLVETLPALYNKYEAETPLQYGFVEEGLNKQYWQEQKMGKIVLYFSCLSIFIACLGLFGLAAFSAETRTKEIGIRKVLGANILQITTLLSKDFLKLVLLAFMIASPIAYYFMDKWLADFAYRITISWWIFAVSGISAVLIALITVSWQSIKAALMNPVKSLRSE
ncbi:MAG: ABC transporter permease [Thermoflexibacter sp.]|jgi:ABC-type antimicrobial peptide transport system permease subunit|nr:ABC transporter permease [Thermoflexibacter sp.]